MEKRKRNTNDKDTVVNESIERTEYHTAKDPTCLNRQSNMIYWYQEHNIVSFPEGTTTSK